MPFEEHALLHHDHGCLHVAEDAGGAPQLHPLGGEDVAHHFAADEHDAGADGGVDYTFLADDQGIVRNDLALELAVDHDGAAERVLAFDLRRFIDERAEIVALHGDRGLAGPLPHGEDGTAPAYCWAVCGAVRFASMR